MKRHLEIEDGPGGEIEKTGLISISTKKGFLEREPRTRCSLTDKGWAALRDCVSHIEKVLNTVDHFCTILHMSAQTIGRDLLTVEEVASHLRLNHYSVRRHIRSGRLKAVRVGGRIRVRRQDIEAFLRPTVVQEKGTQGLSAQGGAHARLTEGLIEELEQLQAAILEERVGRPLPPVESLVEELREERLRAVMGMR